MKKTFVVDVTQRITVTLETEKFTHDLMKDFNEVISDYGTEEDAYEQHAKHIAYLAANGEDFFATDFVEGYGWVNEAGITVTKVRDFDTEVVEGGA